MSGRNKKVNLSDLSQEEKDRLVGTFKWLIDQDKKQNPDLYKNKNDIKGEN